MAGIEHILVATDLTARSDRALDRALGLAGSCGITLLHVLPGGLPHSLASSLQAQIEAFLTERVRQVPRRDIRSLVLSGDPYEVIVREGIALGVDLLVLGEPGKLKLLDLFVGTTAERVIRFTDRPVLMVKETRQGSYNRVLVAFDGSEAAVRALRLALVMSPDAEFRITHVRRRPRTALGAEQTKQQGIPNENAQIRAQIKEALQRTTADSTSRPMQLATEMLEGNPYVVIGNASGSAELLVMGTHSKSSLAMSTGIGSLAKHMLAEVPCDVLVAPP
jgi:nucleotide-binding universal stress UspA family protein